LRPIFFFFFSDIFARAAEKSWKVLVTQHPLSDYIKGRACDSLHLVSNIFVQKQAEVVKTNF
jgi:hypothetical protein